MTEDEKATEAGRLVERYAELKRTIACLRSRLRRAQQALQQMTQALGAPEEIEPSPMENRFDLMGLRGTPRIEIDVPQLRADILALREAMDERAHVSQSLGQMGLGDALR